MDSFRPTIGQTLAAHAERDPAAIAILSPGLKPLTFGELALQIERIGAQLRAAGIGASSRVGVALPRGPEAALISLAVAAKATMLPINPNLTAADLETEIERIKVDALVVPQSEEMPAWAGRSSGLFEVVRATTSFEEIVLTQRSEVARKQSAGEVGEKSVSVIFRTSGTTGTAKRVPVTHENLVAMARKMQRWLKLGPSDRSACILPIYYNAGFKATLLVPLLIGCSVAMPTTTNPQEFDQWVEELRPTWLTAAPAFLQAVLDKVRVREGNPLKHSLRFVLSTASYLAEAVRIDLQAALGVPVVEFYGLCEAGMMTAPAIPPEKLKPGSVGRPPQGELAIRGDNGKFLPAGQTGQVVLTGPSVTPGYLYEIMDTPSGLEDGWLATGDLGVIDSEGYLTIVGRTKEIINRGGEKISPYDVEKALLQHPAVREAAAFGVPHPRLGENVASAVVLHAGKQATSSELIDFIYDRLAPFQMPRHVHILEKFPVGVTGKISRPQLGAMFANHARHIAPPEQPLQIQIAEIWRNFLKRDDIGIDDDFFEIGGDSLQATEMLLELESVTGLTVAPSEIRAQLTIRHLAQALVRVAASDQLMTRVKEGHGTPLFLCHGDFDGWGLYARRLVELLRHDGPVYLLHSNLDAAAGVTSVEEMARRYVPNLLAAWPHGAFKLAGYCHGGLAAWEMARQLGQIGRPVESVMLIDTFSINARPTVRALAGLIGSVEKLVPSEMAARLHDRAMPNLWSLTRRLMHGDRDILQRIASRFHAAPAGAGEAEQPGPSLRWAYYQAMSNYVPPRIDTDVVCVLSEEYSTKAEFAPGVWRRLARRLAYEQVPGLHNTCITSHVVDLATTLNRYLAPV